MRLAGLAFVVLFVAGVALFGELLGAAGDPDSTFDAYFSERGNRARDIAGGYLLAMSGVALIAFAHELERRLREPAEVGARFGLVFLFGATAGGLIMVAAAALMTVSLAISFGRAFDDTGQFATGASALPQFGYVLLCVLAVIPAAAMIVAASLAALRTGALPRWVAYAGFPLALLLLLLGSTVGALVLLPVWVGAASLLITRSPRPATST